MRVFGLVKGAVGCVALLAGACAAAATLVVSFPDFDGPESTGPFPQPSLPVGAPQSYSIPAGERVVSATISGSWGSAAKPFSTAGADVFVNGIRVARCVRDDPGCYLDGPAQRPWSYTFTDPELLRLSGGSAAMTAVQTSDLFIRLGASTLILTTAPQAAVPAIPAIPALSPAGLGALLAAMAAAGGFALRRRGRR